MGLARCRRRIRRKLTFWRVVAALVVIAAIVTVAVVATLGGSLGPLRSAAAAISVGLMAAAPVVIALPAAALLGGEGEGFRIAMHGLNGGRLNIGACSIGGGQAGLEASVAYVRGRSAFGGPLAEKDTVRFALADMDTELETARALLWRAADALDAHHPDALRLCAMAKRVATDAGYRVVDSALQLHGGYGYLHEYGIEKVVRDLRVHQILEGTNEIMRVIIARQIIDLGADIR